MNKQKLVVIGNGMAPGRMLEDLFEKTPDAYDVTIFNAEPRVNYNRLMLSPVLSGEKAYEDIITHDDAWYAERGITLHKSARVAEIDDQGVALEITVARDKGEKLKLEKGINFPAVDLEIEPLTEKDRADLPFVAQNADVVGCSFIQRPADIRLLADELARHRGDRPPQPLLLKIETGLAVRNLPRLIVQAGATRPVGVMIARGDLAMEIGTERLSEVQEEILWLCEAAHIPVVWATQVLQTLIKTGAPSRAEVTDAAMGQRAECVMLNKGPYIVETIAFLAGILRRMDRHQFKKTARLSALTSWRGPQPLDV